MKLVLALALLLLLTPVVPAQVREVMSPPASVGVPKPNIPLLIPRMGSTVLTRIRVQDLALT